MRNNVLVFMTDQQNADTINCKDNPAITPNVDAFLKEAMLFNEAYTTSPHCCPSRAAFFSSLYPSMSGVWNNVEVDNALSRTLYDGVKLFPEVLKEEGYNTIFSGKWHVSAYEGPGDRGFDKVLSEYISNYGRYVPENKQRYNDWEHFYSKKENICFRDRNDKDKEFGEILRPGYPEYHQFGECRDPFDDEMRVNLACEEIRNYDSDKPFFLYMGATGPHDPYYPPQRFIDMYKDVEIHLPDTFDDPMTDKPALYRRTRDCFALTREEHIESIRRYMAFVSFEDYLFGKLIRTLKEKGIFEETYVLYVSDHGDYVGAHGLWAKGLPCFREAYKICAAMSGPGVEKGKSAMSSSQSVISRPRFSIFARHRHFLKQTVIRLRIFFLVRPIRAREPKSIPRPTETRCSAFSAQFGIGISNTCSTALITMNFMI
jgi:Arylsulfatase A and related enzymes